MKLPILKPVKKTRTTTTALDKCKEAPEGLRNVGAPTRSTVYINEVPFTAEVDTMAMVTVLHQRVCERLGIKRVKDTSLNIRLFNMTSEKRTFGITEPVNLRMNRNIIKEQVILQKIRNS